MSKLRGSQIAHPLTAGNVFPPRARELMSLLARGARSVYRGRRWSVVLGGRDIDTMPSAIAKAWIERGLMIHDGGGYVVSDAGRAALDGSR